jgi:hypothetical protein
VPYVWWLRAFGIRDAVLGAGTLMALSDDDDPAAARQRDSVQCPKATPEVARRDPGQRPEASG